MNNYFTADEADMFVFYSMPQALFTNTMYKKMSLESKVLYGLLLDRNSLSKKNNWFDDAGHVYIYFSREEAMEKLNLSDKPISKAFKDLLSIGLIEEKRQGLGKANIIYVKKFFTTSIDIKQSCLNRKISDSGIVKTPTLESDNLRTSNTYSNNTELNNNNSKKSTKEKDVVVDSLQVKMLVDEFKTKYKADLDPKRAKTLIQLKGIDHVTACIDTYGDYMQGRTIRNIGGDFYTFAIDGYSKPVSVNNAPTTTTPSYANFEQREYTEDFYKQFYDNLNS